MAFFNDKADWRVAIFFFYMNIITLGNGPEPDLTALDHAAAFEKNHGQDLKSSL